MKNMTKPIKAAAALLSLAALLDCGAATGQEVRVINSLGDYERFLAAASGKQFEQQEQLWAAFEARFPDIYQDIVFPRSDPNWRAKRRARLQHAFQQLPVAAPRITEMMRHADVIANGQAALFRNAFPDLQPGTPLVFIPISTFNVAAQPTSYGPRSLVVGVDFILENHDVLESLFAHEFFHVYHFGKLEGKPYGSTMASPLWIEGFATFVSARLNPAVPPESIFMSPALAAACTPANLRAWAAEYLKFMHSSAGDVELQSAWFRIATPQPLPRRGYCLGFHVTQLLARDHSLASMASWDEIVYQPHIEAALKELAAPLR